MNDNLLSFDEFVEQIHLESIKDIYEMKGNSLFLDEYNKYIKLKDKNNLNKQEEKFVIEYFKDLDKSYDDYLKNFEDNKRFEEEVANGATFRRRYEWFDKRLIDEDK